jgi:hypothetical protein
MKKEKYKNIIVSSFIYIFPHYYLIKHIPTAAVILASTLLLSNKKIKSFIFLTLPFTFLVISQLIFLHIQNYQAFISKVFMVYVFYLSYFFARNYLNSDSIKIIKSSFFIVFIYALFSGLSYILNYSNFLPPFNCPENNLSQLGILRCATFGEGNYFGNYLVMVMLILNVNIFFIFIMTLISFSPGSFIGFIQLLLAKIIPSNFRNYFNYFTLFAGPIIIYCLLDFFLENYPETSSVVERWSFVKSAFYMFADSPFIGVGIGQFGYQLENYSDLNHIIDSTNQGVRFIPNNVIAEIFSEQGIFGFIILLPGLFKFFNIKDEFTRSDKLIFLFSLFSACPTLYQVFLGFMFGIYTNKINLGYNPCQKKPI